MALLIIIYIILLALLPIILLFFVTKLISRWFAHKLKPLSNKTYAVTLCVQLLAIFLCKSIGEIYFHTCSMCNGEVSFLILSFTASFILLLSLGINLSISHNTSYPIATTLTNYAVIIPYYLFSVVTIITTYAFTVEPLFH